MSTEFKLLTCADGASAIVPKTVPPCLRTIIFVALLVAILSRCGVSSQVIFPEGVPLNTFHDSADFTFYINEEVLVRSACVWRPDGSIRSEYDVFHAGQAVRTTMEIQADTLGQWHSLSMATPIQPLTVERRADTAIVSSPDGSVSINLRPGTVLFENFSPALMSHAVLAYDQELGGKQTFPVFLIPALVMDASLERMESMQRNIAGQVEQFTHYRYSLPGVDIELWVDSGNRVCLGDVPSQHGKYVRDGYEILALKAPSDSLLSQPRYGTIIDTDVRVPMRDGITLATDIYRPDTKGTFPVVLVRTPYGKQMNELQGRYFARRGYVYAVQDCRGRFASEGEWRPFFDEPDDGYDAIEWLARQPWSNGKVGMIGASYLGWTQWWAASGNPPHLVTIIPNVAPPDPYYNIPYEYGAFFQFGAIWWADILEQEATADVTGKTISDIFDKEYARLLRTLPVIDLDKTILGQENTYWREWIRHPDNDEYWDKASFLNKLENVAIPVYHQSGWFDGDGIGSKLNYLAMASHGHPNQKLVLGPWGHTDQATRIGPNLVDFGPEAIVDLETSYLRWLDRWLLGIDNGIDKEPLVSLFVMGSNQWLHGDTYPLPETKFTKLYLASNGNANSSGGDGRLLFEIPASEGAIQDTFTYDPADPTPDPNFYFDPKDLIEENDDDTATVSVDERIAKKMLFYEEINSTRSDILVYETPPLTDSLTFAGPISAVLYTATTAKDTDWFVRLSKVEDDGKIFPLVHGVVRARYRNSTSHPELLTPREIYRYQLDLWQTAICIPTGGRLRVEVTSASFPTFSRNLNTGGHNETDTVYMSARQTIYHSEDYPSHVVLPLIPN